MGEIFARSLFGKWESWLRSCAGIGVGTAWGKDL